MQPAESQKGFLVCNNCNLGANNFLYETYIYNMELFFLFNMSFLIPLELLPSWIEM